MTLPTFIGIGAPRAGSTWLDRLLRSHPAIYLPERRKEIMFFNLHYAHGLDWYANVFNGADGQAAIGEVSPTYLADPCVPARIHAHLPRARLLVMLRNPVDRAYSEYKHHRQRYGIRGSFESYVRQNERPLVDGVYSIHLERFMAYFPQSSFLVLIFEEVVRRPDDAVEALAAFLNVDQRGFDRKAAFAKTNSAFVPRFGTLYRQLAGISESLRYKNLDLAPNLARRLGLNRLFETRATLPDMSPDTRSWLTCHFAASVAKLERLLQRDLGAWKLCAASQSSIADGRRWLR